MWVFIFLPSYEKHKQYVLFIVNHKTLLSEWMFISVNVARIAPILRKTRWPYKVDYPMFYGQIQDDRFDKQSTNTRKSKNARLVENIVAVCENVHENPRHPIPREAHDANFASGFGTSPVHDPTNPIAQT